MPLLPVGPRFYPRIVLVFLALAIALLVVQDWLKQRPSRTEIAPAAAPRRNYGKVAALFVIVSGYVLLLPLLGFRIATAVFVAAAQAALDRPRSPRQWAVLVAVAIGTVAATYLIFESYLLVLLPRGSWTGW